MKRNMKIKDVNKTDRMSLFRVSTVAAVIIFITYVIELIVPFFDSFPPFLEEDYSDVLYGIINPHFDNASLLITVGVTLLISMHSFDFMFIPQKCMQHLSFGIKRRRLFYNRIAVCFSAAFIPVFVPTVVSFFMNVAAFGMSGVLLKGYLCFVLAELEMILFVIAVCAAAAFAADGTAQFSLTAVSLAAFLGIVGANIERLKRYLFGYTEMVQGVYDRWCSRYYCDMFPEPFSNMICVSDYGYFKFNLIFYKDTGLGFNFANMFLKELTFFVLSAVLICVIGRMFEKRFIPEKKNSDRHNIFVSAVVSVTAGFAVMLFTDVQFVHNEKTVLFFPIAAGAAAALICGLIFNAKRIEKNIRKIMPVIIGTAVCIVIPLSVVVLFRTGCFDFANRVPEASSVKKAEVIISSVGYPKYSADDVKIYEIDGDENVFGELTAFQKVISSEQGDEAHLCEIYYLLDGERSFCREYGISKAEYKKIKKIIAPYEVNNKTEVYN